MNFSQLSKKMALTAALLSLPFGWSAQAEEETTVEVEVEEVESEKKPELEFYVSAGSGSADNGHGDFATSTGRSGRADVESKVSGLVALGVKRKNIRVEGEVILLRYDVAGVNYTQFLGAPVSLDVINSMARIEGTANSFGLTAGVWYDVDTGTRWTPYIGAKVGRARVELDYDLSVGPHRTTLDSKKWTNLYQIGVGISTKLRDNLEMDIGYRYMLIEDQDHKFDDGTVLSIGDQKVDYFGVSLRAKVGKSKRAKAEAKARKARAKKAAKSNK